MKKMAFIFVLGLFTFSLDVFAQLNITTNGYIGINNPAPSYRLDVNSPESRFSYPGKYPLHIITSGTDPKLCSNNKIVFYRIDGTGFANIECQVCTQYSDSTAKENITKLTNKGLEAIKQLSGVNYTWKNDISHRKQAGFLAQEVEKVIPEAVFTNDSTKKKSLAYSFIIPYLTEAIKEQLAQVEELKNRIISIEDDCAKASLKSASLITQTTSDYTAEGALLDQNFPNPFNKETKIGCFIPDGAISSFLYIYDMNGTQLKQYPINSKGKQMITINGNSLVPGMYLYTLVVNDKEVDTKRMILTK